MTVSSMAFVEWQTHARALENLQQACCHGMGSCQYDESTDCTGSVMLLDYLGNDHDDAYEDGAFI